MSRKQKIGPFSWRSGWSLGLVALFAGITMFLLGLPDLQDSGPADSLRSSTGERSSSASDRPSSVPDRHQGQVLSGGGVSGASEEIASSLRRIEESAGGADLMAFVFLVDRISRSSSLRVREGILTALLSPSSDQMKAEFREHALTTFASSLAKEYRVGEMLRVLDVSTQEGMLSWKKYLNSRAGANSMEVIEIQPDSDLFVESAQEIASRLLAFSTPSRFRTAVENGMIDPGTGGFAEGVRELLKLDSMKCSEWILSFPEDSPQRLEGFRVVGDWLREVGRDEEAEAFLNGR